MGIPNQMEAKSPTDLMDKNIHPTPEQELPRGIRVQLVRMMVRGR